MINTPIPFQFKEFQIRALGTREDPWFVAADICKACYIQQTAWAVKPLEDDEKGVRIVHTLGGPQGMLCVNESGLYTIMLKSRKPEALQFRKWVTSEVLPALRKTGSFTVAPEPLDIPQTKGEALLLAAQKTLGLEREELVSIAVARRVSEQLIELEAKDAIIEGQVSAVILKEEIEAFMARTIAVGTAAAVIIREMNKGGQEVLHNISGRILRRRVSYAA
jgi:prophage antirepressor-like protein